GGRPEGGALTGTLPTGLGQDERACCCATACRRSSGGEPNDVRPGSASGRGGRGPGEPQGRRQRQHVQRRRSLPDVPKTGALHGR
ncbi:unnamed protein product, partial [Ectocarpus sp. 12 AP-2014]